MFPRPTPQQLAWQQAELTMFLHFGMNTFTDREWGSGTENPEWFNPARLDARQWVRVAQEAGFGYMILTAKHHDGFCLWQSRHTDHSVKNAEWKGGKGDVVREFTEACAEFGMKKGFYLSPWDRHEPTYGDSPAYNAHFRNQLTELLTEYGEVHEVWFDGACGEGPNGKRQEYDWQSFYDVIRTHQPNALIAICGPDVRWVGNEDGYARETEWSVQDANPTFHGDKSGKVWWPAECDVSIRPGWFWHAHEDDKVKSLEHLTDIYYKSVGRNSVLLLNVPPNSDGLVADPDVARLGEFRQAIDCAFSANLAKGKPAEKTPDDWTINLGQPTTFNVTLAQEDIGEGQRVEKYVIEAWVDGDWQTIVDGTTIGYKKLERIEPVTTERVRLRVLKSVAPPMLTAFCLYSI